MRRKAKKYSKQFSGKDTSFKRKTILETGVKEKESKARASGRDLELTVYVCAVCTRYGGRWQRPFP